MADEEKQTQLMDAKARRDSMPVAVSQSGIFRLQPRSFEDFWQICTLMARSDLVPKDYKGKPENVMVAMDYGASLGIPNIQAPQVIAIINGRPGIWGDGFLGVIQSNGVYEWHHEEYDEKKEEWTCKIKRRGNEKPFVGTFSKKDAETIKVYVNGKQVPLIEKPGPWSDGWWKRMCQLRARGFAGRDGFSDILRGIRPAEELRDMDVIDAEYTSMPEEAFSPMPTETGDPEPTEPEPEPEAKQGKPTQEPKPEPKDKPKEAEDLSLSMEDEKPDHAKQTKEEAERRADEFEIMLSEVKTIDELKGMHPELVKFSAMLKEYGYTDLGRTILTHFQAAKKRLGG